MPRTSITSAPRRAICSSCTRCSLTRAAPSPGGCRWARAGISLRSEEHTSELQSRLHLVCRLLLEKKKKHKHQVNSPLIINNTSIPSQSTQRLTSCTSLVVTTCYWCVASVKHLADLRDSSHHRLMI